jgi:putative transposase
MDANALRLELIETILHLPAGELHKASESLSNFKKRPNPPAPQERDKTDWPHAPKHQLAESGTFMVTTGTYQKAHLFNTAERLDLFEQHLLSTAHRYEWCLEAWAVFSNHYHFVGYTNGKNQLRDFLTELHANTARELNRLDAALGRKVWHNFWDKQLTFEKSYLARLNYVDQNAVKHGLVRMANEYKWCSAAWLERTATPAQVKTIYGFKIDQLKVSDEFEPLAIF